MLAYYPYYCKQQFGNALLSYIVLPRILLSGYVGRAAARATAKALGYLKASAPLLLAGLIFHFGHHLTHRDTIHLVSFSTAVAHTVVTTARIRLSASSMTLTLYNNAL